MITFKEFIMSEHETSPHPDQDAMSIEDLTIVLADSEQLQLTIAGANAGGSMVIFRHAYDSRNHLIVLAPRQDQQNPVGYIRLLKLDGYWRVEDLWLKPALRGAGLITNLYRGLSSAGYKLMSGDILSSQAEKVWRRLGELGIAKTIDIQSGAIETFNEKPIGDGDKINGIKPQHHWVTEGQRLLTVFARNGTLTEGQLRAWLAGRQKNFEDGTSGCGTFVVEAEV